MSSIWMQTRFGKAFDLVDPHAEDVDFWEMCRTLADINRFSGAANPAISVAYHSLLVAELVEPDLKPYALLHDGHEYIIGDLTRPTLAALDEIAYCLYGTHKFVSGAMKVLKRNLDVAIWRAAGLRSPTFDETTRIKEADNIALATECRDFMFEPPKMWAVTAKPSPIKYVEGMFGPTPHMIAMRLYREMRAHIPALQMRDAA